MFFWGGGQDTGSRMKKNETLFENRVELLLTWAPHVKMPFNASDATRDTSGQESWVDYLQIVICYWFNIAWQKL